MIKVAAEVMCFHLHLCVKLLGFFLCILRKPDIFRSWEMSISLVVFLGSGVTGAKVYFHEVFLSRSQIHTVPNPAFAECGLQVDRPPSNSLKLTNACRSLMFNVLLLGAAQIATLYECRKLANVFSKHTLCIFSCNWWPFITYLCVGHSSVVMWSITHVNVSLQNPLNNIWTYRKKSTTKGKGTD